MRLSPGPCCHLRTRCLPSKEAAAHRDRLESERGSYLNLRTGALGRVCARLTLVPARGATPACRCASKLVRGHGGPKLDRKPRCNGGAGFPVAARQAKALKLRDKEPWPTKGSPSLPALRSTAAAISHRTARCFDRSRALPPTPACCSPFIAAWC